MAEAKRIKTRHGWHKVTALPYTQHDLGANPVVPAHVVEVIEEIGHFVCCLADKEYEYKECYRAGIRRCERELLTFALSCGAEVYA